ncbi:hypothetical protein EZJ49_08185 [Bdellovibrio bacteriovorus]|uniref:hypothetical protein n=1 Tax=Bdellovibrio bacteriovorus TaxID=959 RepID=UPI0021CF5C1A|nr:hypothetical protein [Bdellovibrio bacteriovorus]UXR66226.1 hypothetical protein EZJ49_08185 [Bdellovibrio bacteriovorus]
MKRHIHQYVICGLFLFTLGCDRLTVDSSKISLQVPRSLSGKMNSASTPLSLKHLAVQVTAADMSQPITFLQDAGDSSALGSEITLEIPSGTNRLVQVLAAYAPAGSDDGAILYYGDVSKSLTGTTENLDVPLQMLGNESSVEGRLQGRYLSSTNTGPSGELKLFYRPAGKPALLVDKKMMFGGWFEMVAFNNIPMDYVLPDGSFMGEQWTTESLTPGPHLIKVAKPATYRRDWSSPGAMLWKPQTAENKFFGFFAKNASFLTDKTVCIQSTTINGDTIYSGNDYLTMTMNTPLPLKHFPTGTTPTVSAQALTFIGGRDITVCNSQAPANEFQTYLKFTTNPSDNRFYSIQESIGIKGLHTLFAQPGAKPMYRYDMHFSADSAGVFFELRTLPGAMEGLDSYVVYTRTPPTNMYSMEDIRCEPEHLQRNNWSQIRSLPLFSADNTTLKVYLAGVNPEIGKQSVLCLAKAGRPYGNALSLWHMDITTPITSSLSITTSPTSGVPVNASPAVGECRPVDVYLQSPSLTLNPYTDLNYTVTATDYNSSPVAVLYTSSDCSGTPMPSITKTFPAKVTDSTFYVKSGSSGNFTLTVINNKGLANPYPYVLNIMTPESSPMSLSLAVDTGFSLGSFPPLSNIFPQGCQSVVAFFHSNGIPVSASGTATVSWKEPDGISPYSPPSDIKIVNNCSSRTAQGSSVAITNGIARFGIEAGAGTLTNVNLVVDGLGLSAGAYINNAPLVHHLALNLPAGTPTVNQCTAVNVQAQDSNGASALVPTKKKLIFTVQTHGQDISAPGPGVSYYSDSSCMISINQAEIPAGSSATTVYMKVTSLGAFYLGYFSEHAEVGSSTPTTEIPVNPLPGPLSVDLGGNINIPNTVQMGYGIWGGTPPYTATVTQGSATVAIIQPYVPNWQLSVTPTAAGSLQVLVQDSAGQSTTVNLTVY